MSDLIVLNIDSPGGQVDSTDAIARRLQDLDAYENSIRFRFAFTRQLCAALGIRHNAILFWKPPRSKKNAMVRKLRDQMKAKLRGKNWRSVW